LGPLGVGRGPLEHLIAICGVRSGRVANPITVGVAFTFHFNRFPGSQRVPVHPKQEPVADIAPLIIEVLQLPIPDRYVPHAFARAIAARAASRFVVSPRRSASARDRALTEVVG
jgi:hypothetical protein